MRDVFDGVSQRAADPPVHISLAPARFVLLPLAASITGYSVKALQRKIEEGLWLDGREYRRAPDGRIHVDMQAYERWVMSGGQRRKPRAQSAK